MLFRDVVCEGMGVCLVRGGRILLTSQNVVATARDDANDFDAQGTLTSHAISPWPTTRSAWRESSHRSVPYTRMLTAPLAEKIGGRSFAQTS